MSAVEVTITGILYDRVNRTSQNVVLIGEATLTGVGPGGGPIIPEPQPPGIWPSPGHPAHPIAPGGRPGQRPPGEPGIWPKPGHPEHPIELPPEGEKPPEVTEPPVSWKSVWHPTEGWVVVGVINPEVPHPVPGS